jgi:hypothetical protein
MDKHRFQGYRHTLRLSLLGPGGRVHSFSSVFFLAALFLVLGSTVAFGEEPKEPSKDEKAVVVLQDKLNKIEADIKENQRLHDYYRNRTIRSGMVMSGHSAGPGTHLGPNGESVEPLQPSTAVDEFAQNQETAQYYKDSIAALKELAEKTQKDIKAAQNLTAEKKEPRKESGGGGY